MTARTHDGFAFASLLTIATLYPPASLNLLTVGASIIGNIIGALIPDMDQAGNRLWDLLPGGDSLGKIFRQIFYKHRTITHSLLGVFLIYKGLNWLLPKFLNASFIDPQMIFISIMIGYLSHLLADAFTKEGLPLLFPIPINFGLPPIAVLRITTDSWVETYIVQPGIGIYLIWFITTHQSQVLSLIQLIRQLST